jgi:uncharacterized protein (TIGR03084 family)
LPAVAVDMQGILTDLGAEQAELDAVVAGLSGGEWAQATPAEGWTIHDAIAHLAYFDAKATLAATDPDRFTAELATVLADPALFSDAHLDHGRSLAPLALLGWWRELRAALMTAMAGLDPAVRVPWYGPPMGPASLATARLMETWCHGQDVLDALGRERLPSARLRHIAHLAIRTRPFNYASWGREPPPGEVAVILRAPDGATWTWGDPNGPDRVRGDALDFALVTTQRRHPDDTELVVEGPLATEWMAIAQTYAGPPGPGRRPGQFRRRSVAPSA